MLFHQELVGRYKTPVSDERVSACFIQKLISDAQVEHVERSARIEALISLDEYGYESVVFDKDVEPLRWLRVDERTIRLSDDTAETTPPSVRQYDLNSVEISHDVDYQQALVGIELHGKGGLLVANQMCIRDRPYPFQTQPPHQLFYSACLLYTSRCV